MIVKKQKKRFFINENWVRKLINMMKCLLEINHSRIGLLIVLDIQARGTGDELNCPLMVN